MSEEKSWIQADERYKLYKMTKNSEDEGIVLAMQAEARETCRREGHLYLLRRDRKSATGRIIGKMKVCTRCGGGIVEE